MEHTTDKQTNSEKEFLSIKKRDIDLQISVHRSILFCKDSVNLLKDYLMTVIKNFPGKVIYVTSGDEKIHLAKLLDMNVFAPIDLAYINDFSKIIISTDSKELKPLQAEMQNIYEFIKNRLDKKTLVIIDDAHNTIPEYIPDIIRLSPDNCIIIFESDEQMRGLYKKKNIAPEKELTQNYWSVTNLHDFSK